MIFLKYQNSVKINLTFPFMFVEESMLIQAQILARFLTMVEPGFQKSVLSPKPSLSP
jgi:hypothetical protein